MAIVEVTHNQVWDTPLNISKTITPIIVKFKIVD
jgi:hypothetical protein